MMKRTTECLLAGFAAVVLAASPAAALPDPEPTPQPAALLVATAVIPAEVVGTAETPETTVVQAIAVPESAAAAVDAAPEAGRTDRAALDARVAELSDRLAAAVPGSAEADAVDVDLVAAIEAEQAALDAALDRLGIFGGAPETDPRWQQVHLHGEALLRLVELRGRSREKISKARSRAGLTFGREGFDQLGREVRTVGLAARYHLAKRRHTVDEAPQMARDVFTVGAALTRFVLVATTLIVIFWIRRRWRAWLEQLRRLVFRSVTSVGSKRRAQRLMSGVETVAPWSLFLLGLAVLRWALGPVARATEVRTLLTLLIVFGCYRLTIDAVAAWMVSVASHYGLDTSDENRAKLLRSVRTVLRVGAVLVLITLVSRGMGQGFLSSLILKLGWIFVLGAVLVELFRWRSVMIDTFLKLQPTGRLSATVRATRSRWYGALVAPAAFLWLAGRGVATVTREFALGFEQTQKALAFLFRQKVERQAEKQGYAAGDVAELPAEVVAAFAEGAVENGPLLVSHFPGLDELHKLMSHWRDTGARGSFLLTGERGIGKTTWLYQVRRDDLEIDRVVLGRRVKDAGALTRRLAELLEVDVGPEAAPADLARALLEGPRRVVALDMAQHLFLADVGGYDAFSAFAALVNRTCRQVFWLCSMSGYAWRHLRAVRPDATVFRSRVHLTGWNDEQIGALIAARCAASGVRFNYADLVVDRMEGVSVRSRLIESQDGYTRLLWDYSDGNPRAALHFFLRSLDPDRSGRVRVRLFKAPDVAMLEDGGEDGLFVLAAIVVHESIALDDLEEVTRFDRVQCFIHLDRLQEIGAVVLDEGMYRVSTTWHRAAVRLLKRRNLLPE